jgi:8-oxo-dGTP diphosphatase
MTEYVAGFLFDGDRVALVVKNRPEWQKGKMNGIGGHIEPGETPEQAMAREFVEETGYERPEPLDWMRFAELSGSDYKVYFFYEYGDHRLLHQPTDETVVSVDIGDLNFANSIPSLTWLIPLALSMNFDRANLFKIQEVA